MEFKVDMRNLVLQQNCILIESKWNLKLFNIVILPCKLSILIESKWNLKYFTDDEINFYLDILIESKWNLKL